MGNRWPSRARESACGNIAESLRKIVEEIDDAGGGDSIERHVREPGPSHMPDEAELLTAGEFEAGDSGAPVEGAVRLEVLGGVPESAVVDWIDSHAAVIA